MNNRAIAIFTFIFIVGAINAQMTINSGLEAIGNSNAVIETGKSNIRQSVSNSPDAPYMVEFIRETEDLKKGKVTTEIYSLNLALLDERSIKRNTKKDEMSIEVSTPDGKMIKYQEDEDTKYVDDWKIITPDIDAAREAEKVLKEILVKAKEAWKSSIAIPGSLKPIKSRMTEFPTRLQYGDDEISQTTEGVEGFNDMIQIKQITRKKGKEEFNSYTFNIADLDKAYYDISNEKELIGLKFRANGKKNLIREQSDDKIKYVSDVKLYFDTPSQALVAKELLSAAIPLASEITKTRHAKYKDCENCGEQLYAIMEEASRRLNPLEGTGNCDANIKIRDLEKPEDDEKLIFHWGDINPKSIDINYSSSYQKIKFEVMHDRKFIAIYDNEGLDKYDSDFTLNIQNVDNAKIIKILMESIIADCQRTISANTMAWLSDQIASMEIIDRYTQSLTPEEEKCSYAYSLYDNEKGEEQNYEFNMYDLNDKGIELKISGDKITLDIPTVRNEKVITRYDAKGELKYEKELEIMFEDLELARIAELTIQKAISGCK